MRSSAGWCGVSFREGRDAWPSRTPERPARKGAETMAMDIQGDQKVVVYKDGVDQYEGLWRDRDLK